MTSFIYIADVFCPWCFGFAPIMQRIAEEHETIPVKVYGGNLVSRPITLREDAEAQPGLADFWHEVEGQTGRSLQGAINAVLEDRDVLLYSPGADEILAVLNEMAPGHELEQLFMLEDLFYGQGANLFSENALNQIAAAWRLQATAFKRALDQDAALKATENNLRKAASILGDVTAYPSLFLARDNKIDAVSRGYVGYETVAARVRSAMQDLHIEEASAKNCSRYGGCSLRAK